ncbi:M48 family metallopeptidase [Bifidobacterium stellenboschense]|uniref:Metal-dependent hydrolase n=1 Tax=Bifidobacterium stellenboschense TaxID=762211 RepID=A0A087E0U4_9BIFI|nr:SprT family zinc-dependent metalloprotease [Bifidobacterium stellenboschense]KFJ01395.1 metal-dependent hydrolase [Bifidobacterium stellenboschense]
MPYRRRPSAAAPRPSAVPRSVSSVRVVEIDGVAVTVTRKRIRNLYLRVKPPTGTVEVSAPMRMAEYRIRDFVRDRRDWIAEQQSCIAQSRRLVVEEMAARGAADAVDVPLEGLDDASFASQQPLFDDADGTVGGTDRPHAPNTQNPPAATPAFEWTDERKREAAAAIESQLPALLDKWAPIVGKRPTHVTLRLMTSRWGSCTPKTGRIRINLQLGLMEPRFLEYVLVHELTHLWEHGHGPRFRARMDAYLPGWRALRRELNRRAVL